MENEVCEYCGDVEAEYLIDPFIREIWEEIVWRWLCEECHQNRADES